MENIEFKVKVKVTITNSNYIARKNMHRIFAVSDELCTNVFSSKIDNKTYKEKWAIKEEPEGFIFREITHNGGINGHHKTLRSLIAGVRFRHIKVIFVKE